MAKDKVKKKAPEAEQQTTSGDLGNPANYRSAFAPGDWIIYEANGSRFVLTNAEYTTQYEKA